MLRQSSSRSHRSKKLRPSQSLQAFLLVAVAVWIVYQLTRSYGKQRVVVVDTDGDDGEPARRWLGRKGFVDLAASQASVDDPLSQAEDDDPLSQAGDDDEEDQEEADEDDGVDSDADDVGGGLAADEEEDDTDSLSQSSSNDDELKTTQGQAQNGLNVSVAPPVNATDTVQDGVPALPVNATGSAADDTGHGLTSSGYPLKNITSSAADLLLRDRETAGDVAKKLLANSGSPGENRSLQINKNGTADSVAGRVI